MKRRQFMSLLVPLSLFSGLSLPVSHGLAASKSMNHPSLMIELESFTIDDVIVFLQALPLERLVTAGQWNLSQIFNHAAQSIEFSMMGYPQHKSEMFRRSIGPLAFQAFALWGRMSHDLAEAIPGANKLKANDDSAALQRLIQALTHFDQFQGPLQPHFAYGELNKHEYALAHVLHLNNHLEEVSLVQTA